MNLYREESYDPKYNAQRNLQGRTHYVDDDTLRLHKARILSSRAHAGGLLFSLIESVVLDMNSTQRGFRYVVFDVFGSVLEHASLDDAYKTRNAAAKALAEYLETLNAVQITRQAIARQRKLQEREWAALLAKLDEIATQGA